MQDSRYVHLESGTSKNETVFSLVKDAVRPYHFRDKVHMSLAYTLDLNKNTVERTVYTGLDWLRDIGGLQSTLRRLGWLVIFFFHGNGLAISVFERIFKQESKDQEPDDTTKDPTDAKLARISAREPSGPKHRIY